MQQFFGSTSCCSQLDQCVCQHGNSSTRGSQRVGNEIFEKTGFLELSPLNKQRMLVRVRLYSNGIDLYMILSSTRFHNPREKMMKLRNCTATVIDSQTIEINSLQDSYEQPLHLIVPDSSDVTPWLTALNSKSQHTTMPTAQLLESPILEEQEAELEATVH